MAQAFISQHRKQDTWFWTNWLCALFMFIRVFHGALKEKAGERCWGQTKLFVRRQRLRLWNWKKIWRTEKMGNRESFTQLENWLARRLGILGRESATQSLNFKFSPGLLPALQHHLLVYLWSLSVWVWKWPVRLKTKVTSDFYSNIQHVSCNLHQMQGKGNL